MASAFYTYSPPRATYLLLAHLCCVVLCPPVGLGGCGCGWGGQVHVAGGERGGPLAARGETHGDGARRGDVCAGGGGVARGGMRRRRMMVSGRRGAAGRAEGSVASFFGAVRHVSAVCGGSFGAAHPPINVLLLTSTVALML